MTKIWAGSESQLFKISGNSILNEIPNGIWTINESMSGIYLSKVGVRFEFNHKIYGKDSKFINHVLKTYEHTEKNLGVLLNGIKGAGKSVTAKMLANQSNLPIVIIDRGSIDRLSYFNDVAQSLCFFIDEFEKITPKDDNNKSIDNPELLSFVDGYSNSNKHLFLFTSNNKNISDYFIDRPGRIRYIKEYNSLPEDVINEIIEDMLVNKSFKTSLIKWVKYFKYLTIDTLVSIIQEINIHNIDPSEFKEFFNADNEKSSFSVNLSLINGNSKVLMFEREFHHKSIMDHLNDIRCFDSIYIPLNRHTKNTKGDSQPTKINTSFYISREYSDDEIINNFNDDKIVLEIQLNGSYLHNDFYYTLIDHDIEIIPGETYEVEFEFIRQSNFFKNTNMAF